MKIISNLDVDDIPKKHNLNKKLPLYKDEKSQKFSKRPQAGRAFLNAGEAASCFPTYFERKNWRRGPRVPRRQNRSVE